MIEKFISALGIAQVGKKKVEKLGIKTFDDFINFNDDQSSAGREIIKWKLENDIDEVKKIYSYMNIKTVLTGGKKVCMTGTGHKGRKELIKDIESKGDIFIDGVTSETNILLTDDVNGTSSKLVKARKLGIEIKTYKEYFND